MTTTVWRVAPVAWLPIALAVVAESVSNALRAYGLGMHLEKFTIQYQGYTVSLAGAVLVLAAIAISLSQARAAWVALTPGRPARQRFVAGLAAAILLAISITAMALHVLEAQRAKVGDESGARVTYDNAKAAYDKAKAEFDALGTPRPVSVIQAEVSAAKIDMAVWRRSQQCSDISRDDTKAACAPVISLYKERGAAARKAELEPEVHRLRTELASLARPGEQTVSEGTVANYWAWIMGLGVVFVATFGTVIFATATEVSAPPAVRQALTFEKPLTPDEIEEIRRLILGAGRTLSNQEVADAIGVSEGEASKRVSAGVARGILHKQRVGREVAISAIH